MADDNGTQPAVAANEQVALSRVSVKLPEFDESSSQGWFDIVEAQFVLANITAERTKFFHALSGLPAQLVTRLPQAIKTQYNYTVLKESVLALVERSRPELFERLLTPDILTGRPSTCLQSLQRTADQVGVGDAFIRHKFIQSMPANIMPVLQAQDTLSIDELGKLADDLVAMTTSKNRCYQVRDLERANEQSCSSINKSHSSRSAPRHQGHSLKHHMSVRPFQDEQRARICRFHIYYESRARCCKS